MSVNFLAVCVVAIQETITTLFMPCIDMVDTQVISSPRYRCTCIHICLFVNSEINVLHAGFMELEYMVKSMHQICLFFQICYLGLLLE
jgi:hypothetical protein